MDKFDMKNAKPLTAIGVILIIFVMAIANAYKYLPEQANNASNINTEMNLPGDEDDTQVRSEENIDQEDAEQTTKEEAIENKKIRLIGPEEPIENNPEPELIPLENISESDTAEPIQADVETYESVMLNAKKLTSEKKLVDALSEYKKAVTLAKTSTEKANCYEEISMIFAKAKKYGTALSYAQRAYNISPSTSREILLARLYYKTGATDKASDKVNDILRRDFSQD